MREMSNVTIAIPASGVAVATKRSVTSGRESGAAEANEQP